MPVRNTIRFDIEESFYHVYNRGVNKQPIYHSAADKDFFLSLLARYLTPKPTVDRHGNIHKTYSEKLEINSFCLMGNHYHLLCYQKKRGSLKEFMQAVSNSYIRYYNKKYNRRGPLFESRYKASLIETTSYLEHISRYIHLNPENWETFAYSSLPAYIGKKTQVWIHPERILEIFDGEDYLTFMKDYESHKQLLDEIKQELADL